MHERRTRRNRIRIIHLVLLPVTLHRVHVEPLAPQLLLQPALLFGRLRRILRRPKPPPPLLIHFSTRRHPIDRHIHELARPHDPKQPVDIREDLVEDLVLRRRGRLVLRMKARMNNPVHIQVQVVKLDPVRIGLRGVDRHLDATDTVGHVLDAVHDGLRVAVGQPLEERRNSHGMISTEFIVFFSRRLNLDAYRRVSVAASARSSRSRSRARRCRYSSRAHAQGGGGGGGGGGGYGYARGGERKESEAVLFFRTFPSVSSPVLLPPDTRA